MNLYNVVKQVLPPFLFDMLRSLHYHLFPSRGNYLKGNYSSWSEAMQASTGYDSDHILQKTKDALLKVKTGEAVYERDSVLFDKIQYSWPLLAGLMWITARTGGRLHVLDFGGSLGSTYFQNRAFLQGLPDVQWCIIEQPKHVQVGKEFFEDKILRFYSNVDEYLAENKPDVIIMSSVLQYLENPYDTLGTLLKLPSNFLILDRTPFSNEQSDKLFVQKIRPEIFDASYPMWVFSLREFNEHTKNLIVIEEYTSLEKNLFGYQWKGFIMERCMNGTI